MRWQRQLSVLVTWWREYHGRVLGRLAAIENGPSARFPYGRDEARRNHRSAVWQEATRRQRLDGAPLAEFLRVHCGGDIGDRSAPTSIVIDSSSDGYRAAYVALVIVPGEKPRLLYGTAIGIRSGDVERWGIRRVVARTNRRHGGGHPLLVFTDSKSIADTARSVHVHYRWLPRDTPLICQLHQAANALRRSLPARRSRVKSSGATKTLPFGSSR